MRQKLAEVRAVRGNHATGYVVDYPRGVRRKHSGNNNGINFSFSVERDPEAVPNVFISQFLQVSNFASWHGRRAPLAVDDYCEVTATSQLGQ